MSWAKGLARAEKAPHRHSALMRGCRSILCNGGCALALLAAVPAGLPSASAEVTPLGTDPGWGPVLQHEACGPYTFHCTNEACSKVGTIGGGGTFSFTFMGKGVKVTGSVGAAVSSEFVASLSPVTACKAEPQSDDRTCQYHGVGCGSFQILVGACPGGTPAWSETGWTQGCG